MRGRHPAPELLDAFIAGEVDDAKAVAIANHLDSCPTCRQAAFARDDLHSMLMAADEHAEPPEDLVQDILDHQPAPTPEPSRAPVIAMALLAASGLIFTMLGNPVGLVSEGAAWGRGLSLAATAVSGPSGLGGWLAAPGLAVVVGVGLLVVSQRMGRS